MKRCAALVLLSLPALLAFGCATAPQVKYVMEAEAVVSDALDPVFVESARLLEDIKKKLPKVLSKADDGQAIRENLEQAVQKNIMNTKRFKDVIINTASGESYSIIPRIDSVSDFYLDVPGDPTRKRAGVKARVHLDVEMHTSKGEHKKMASSDDERTKEVRIRSAESKPDMRDLYLGALRVAFASASDKLGSKFNPGSEPGEVTKVDGEVVYVRMNTSLFRKMLDKDRTVDILDNDNFKIAHVEASDVKEGMVMGRMFKTTGKSVAPGMKTSARVIRLE